MESHKAPRILSCPECGTKMHRRPGNVYGCHRCFVITYWAATKKEVKAIMKSLSDVTWTKDKPKNFDKREVK